MNQDFYLEALIGSNAELYKATKEYANHEEKLAFCFVWLKMNFKKIFLVSDKVKNILIGPSKKYEGFFFKDEVIYELRPDLQNLFNLNDELGRAGFRAWLHTDGSQEVQAFELETAYSADQNLQKLTEGYDVYEQKLAFCLVWWMMYVKKPIEVRDVIKDLLFESSQKYKSFSFKEEAIYLLRPDLQKAFDLATEDGSNNFKSWLNTQAVNEIVDISMLKNNDKQHASFIFKNLEIKPFGINVIGFYDGVLGIGEDVRTFCKALDYQNIPFSIFKYPETSDSKLEESSFVDKVRTDLPYNINIFVMPAAEVLRFFIEKQDLLGYEYNVAFSPWELPFLPKEQEILLDIVQEFWCSSQFIKDSIPDDTRCKIEKIPLAFDFKKQKISTPKRKRFSFLIIFDSLSFPQRKNPFPVIDGFVSLSKKYDVELTIKTMHLRKKMPSAYQKLVDASKIANITIIDEVLSRDELNNLISSHHVFVSSHRSEGYGRIIPEAMSLGTPCLVSKFSGNMDYCNDENVIFLEGDLIPVGDDYQFSDERQYWFSVSQKEVESKLAYCINHYDELLKKAGKALSEINVFSYMKVSEIIKGHIDRIKKDFSEPLALMPEVAFEPDLQHWLSEGRKGHKIPTVIENVFPDKKLPDIEDKLRVLEYRSLNVDLAPLSTTDLFKHYLEYAKKENRRIAYSRYESERTVEPLDLEKTFKILICYHLFYLDLFKEFWESIQHVFNYKKIDVDLRISIPLSVWKPELNSLIYTLIPTAKILITDNAGRDIGGLFSSLRLVQGLELYDAAIVMHSKKSLHITLHFSDKWRRDMYEALIGEKVFERNLSILLNDTDLGMVAPGKWQDTGVANNSKSLAKIEELINEKIDFTGLLYPSGGMFWIRPEILQTIFNKFKKLGFQQGRPDDRAFNEDGQYEHVIERYFAYHVYNTSKKIEWV